MKHSNLLEEREPQQQIGLNATQRRRTAAMVGAELLAARESIGTLDEKVAAAEIRKDEARKRYDADIAEFALGRRENEPNTEELLSAIPEWDALRRVQAATLERIEALAAEFVRADKAEATAAGGESLAAFTSAAEGILTEFETALRAAKSMEAALFDALYDREGGLLCALPPELARQAKLTRLSVARRLRVCAEEIGYIVNPRFETDGEIFLGEQKFTSFRGFPVRLPQRAAV